MIHDLNRRASRRFFVAISILALFALVFGNSAALASNSEDRQKKDPRLDYALIFGTVWNAQNRPADGIRVKIRRANEKKAKWELVSDRNGEFAQRVPVGSADYVVWAEQPHHKGPVAEVKVHIDYNERSDIGLHLTE